MEILIGSVFLCLGVGALATISLYCTISKDEEPPTISEWVVDQAVGEIGDLIVPLVGGYMAGNAKHKLAPRAPKPKRPVPPRKLRIRKSLAYGYGGTLVVALIVAAFLGLLWLVNTYIGGIAGMVFCLVAVPLVFWGTIRAALRIVQRFSALA